jgi:amidase
VADAAWFGACLMGQDNRDEATYVRGPLSTLHVPLEPFNESPRLAIVRTPKWSIATDHQRAHFDECVAKLAGAGAQVRELALPKFFEDAWDNVMLIAAREAVKSFLSVESRHRIRLSPALQELLDRGHRVSPEQYARAHDKREHYRQWLDGQLGRFDAIVTIPTPGEAPEGLSSTGDATFNSLWTQAGLPAVTIPSGRGPKGLPLGFQVVGRYREDERALRVAAWCEAMLGVDMGLPAAATTSQSSTQ